VARVCGFLAVLLGSVGFAFVAWFDHEEVLGAEFSWIRYTTAFSLVAAAIVAWFIARGYARDGGRMHVRLWVVLGIIFLGLAGDELFMMHEAFGFFIQSRFHATHLATDLVTMMYPVVALLLLLFLASKPAYLREYFGHPAVITLFVCAAIVFFIAQMGDTFDKWTHEQLVTLGVARSGNPKLLFSDFWYPIWGPKQLMNDVEEVFECIAAALFLSSFALFWIERRSPHLQGRTLFSRPKASRAALAIVVVGFTALSAWLAAGRSMASPVVGFDAKAIATAQDSLFHTDMVVFHPRWGLIIANEGGGNVLQVQNGVKRFLPDPDSLVTDTDSVLATDDAVYASCPSLHTVFRYTEAEGWHPFATEADGLRAPEGLVIVDSLMYVLDEDNHLIAEVNMTTKHVREMPLTDVRWMRPEGIAYHPDLGKIVITDDTRGTLATVDFDSTVTPFALPAHTLANPEDVCVTSNGHILVSDTGRREIIDFTAEGKVLRRIRFHPMYGYVVGVALIEGENGDADRLYVVNSDGYASISFMPSTLWEITVPHGTL